MNKTPRPSWLLALLLAGCAGAPGPHPGAPPPAPEPTTAPAPAVPGPETVPVAAPAQADLWRRLRDSFVMDDCADPAALHWARFYARKPGVLHDYLGKVAPQIDYIQQRAQARGIPGEFVLVPWVESRYRQVPGTRRSLAGMWQLTPSTARSIGLKVGRAYDGRMDGIAATDAVMKLLGHYHDWFQDWRLADYAYNAGKGGIERAVEAKGAPPPQPVVPDLPVRPVVRAHLARLLGIACVVRDPARFKVTLPELAPEDRLVAVEVRAGLSLARAARLAGMPAARLAGLNAGYRNGRVATGQRQLLVPNGSAARLRDALLADARGRHGPGAVPDAGHATRPRTHTVRTGETLWKIARRYAVDVSQLRDWNGLNGDTITVGQQLRISSPR